MFLSDAFSSPLQLSHLPSLGTHPLSRMQHPLVLGAHVLVFLHGLVFRLSGAF